MAEKERLQYIYFIKAFAVLLILNSHMDSLYPSSALAIGGGLVMHCSSSPVAIHGATFRVSLLVNGMGKRYIESGFRQLLQT